MVHIAQWLFWQANRGDVDAEHGPVPPEPEPAGNVLVPGMHMVPTTAIGGVGIALPGTQMHVPLTTFALQLVWHDMFAPHGPLHWPAGIGVGGAPGIGGLGVALGTTHMPPMHVPPDPHEVPVGQHDMSNLFCALQIKRSVVWLSVSPLGPDTRMYTVLVDPSLAISLSADVHSAGNEAGQLIVKEVAGYTTIPNVANFLFDVAVCSVHNEMSISSPGARSPGSV